MPALAEAGCKEHFTDSSPVTLIISTVSLSCFKSVRPELSCKDLNISPSLDVQRKSQVQFKAELNIWISGEVTMWARPHLLSQFTRLSKMQKIKGSSR